MGMGHWLRSGSYLNLPYIYDTITNGEDPICYAMLNACPDEIRVVLTDAATGQAYYADNGAFRGQRCDVLMASCCLPIFCRPVAWNGRLWFDGGVADSLPVEQALVEGCERVVAILCRPKGYQKIPERGGRWIGTLLRRYPETARVLLRRHETYMASLRRLEQLEREGRAVLIRPVAALPMSTFTRRPAALLEQVLRQGYEDAARAMGTPKE
jgi:predicted patatin/cPLA2 family phospholipase